MNLHAYALVVAGVLGPSPSPVPVAAVCGTAIITPSEILNSKTAQPGQPFKFSLTSLKDPQHQFTTLAPGASGVGLISVVRHAAAGGDPGLLVLETRYLVATDGAHVPISLIRTVNGLFMGRTRNSPALLGLIPYVGYVTGTYDALHKGTDVAIGPGDTLLVALGDQQIEGACTLPPSPAPSPTASPASSASPAPPSPTP
jgi:hypothetical protein